MITVVVTCEGGVVVSIESNFPDEVQVIVADYDAKSVLDPSIEDEWVSVQNPDRIIPDDEDTKEILKIAGVEL